ncbi:hypothetical protein Clacol_003023 [Clathrus columnatus]|uniref:Cytochrome P450 n=1 Tax=Clathrus columnatus TaxID=1419009 RepID=A0AAV5A2C9_9AGAM|nr:hypothetical protein Clacol_003023 [Clathrus columnatus]
MLESINPPPGVTFLVNFAPNLLGSIAFVVLTNRYAPFHISGLTWVIFFVALIPIIATVKGTVHRIMWAKECKRLGAQMPPFVHHTIYTMGIDIIWRVVKSFSYGYINDALPGWDKLYGTTFGFEIFGDYVLTTSEPDHIKTILSTDFESFEKGELFQRDYQSVLGTGVFNSDGEMWKFHRAMTRPFFVRERITDFDLFDHHANAAILKMKSRFAEGEPVDFQVCLSNPFTNRNDRCTCYRRFTLDTATEFLFGSCVNSLSAPLPYAWNSSKVYPVDKKHRSDIFAEAFNAAQLISSRRSRLMDFWFLVEFFEDQTRKPMSIIYEYIDPVLKEALARRASGVLLPGDETKPETLLDHLLQESDGQPLSFHL